MTTDEITYIIEAMKRFDLSIEEVAHITKSSSKAVKMWLEGKDAGKGGIPYYRMENYVFAMRYELGFCFLMRKAMKARGITSEDIAKELGAHISTVRNWQYARGVPQTAYREKLFSFLKIAEGLKYGFPTN